LDQVLQIISSHSRHRIASNKVKALLLLTGLDFDEELPISPVEAG
jgi:hypothetical protein